MKRPKGTRLVILIDHDFADAEFWSARAGFEKMGATVAVAGPVTGATYQSDSGRAVAADCAIRDVCADGFDALILPGLAGLPGKRTDAGVIAAIRSFNRSGKVIGFIGRGATAVIEAGVVRDRHCTSAGAWKESMIDAGAIWSDAPVVRDGTLVSGRGLADTPAFIEGLIGAIPARSPRRRANPAPPSTNRSSTG